MVNRIILSILVGIITAFLFWLVGTLLLPIAANIANILITVSYGAGVVAGLYFYVSGRSAIG